MQDNDLPQIGTPMQTDETRVEVIQADRDALYAHLNPEGLGGCGCDWAEQIKRGEQDDYSLLQTFARHRLAFAAPPAVESKPVPMILYCPKCHKQHIDEPDERTPEWDNPPHRSHLCHACGCIWRPADVATEGVRSIRTAGEADTWGWDGASVKPTLHPSDREAIARIMYVAFGCRPDLWEDNRKLYYNVADAILALSGSLAPANPTEKGETK